MRPMPSASTARANAVLLTALFFAIVLVVTPGTSGARPGYSAVVPPAPSIVATRVGQRVRIAYSFRVWPTTPARRIVSLLTAVQSSGPRYGPLHKQHRIRTRSGVVWQPLGLGRGPFMLYAAAYTREGSSRTVKVRVRGG